MRLEECDQETRAIMIEGLEPMGDLQHVEALDHTSKLVVAAVLEWVTLGNARGGGDHAGESLAPTQPLLPQEAHVDVEPQPRPIAFVSERGRVGERPRDAA